MSADGRAQLDLSDVVSSMLTPGVTQSLPAEWRGTYTAERARAWIEERDRQGATLLVVERSSRIPAGLMILFENDNEEAGGAEVRLGFLLSESFWGKGLASELVQGFVEWCRKAGVASIVGGVASDNFPSQRVLEKNGFVRGPNAEDTAERFFELRLRRE